ncbi:hypothetical protein SAMN05421747_101590 [Parapedobacter composti]|uniref:Uncharacterized protein n=1 Tax=Parapedobacter composti TaxID=623281 RepID=A0A1I1EHH5_9SPHI|nr:hypothetical protein SAMN05421747_101590 [Parapedobacter composti]
MLEVLLLEFRWSVANNFSEQFIKQIFGMKTILIKL